MSRSSLQGKPAWTLAAILAVGCAGEPQAPPPEPLPAKIQADSGGPIRLVLAAVNSPRRSPLRNQELVQRIVTGLGPRARVLILAHAEMILDPNPLPDRMLFVPVPDELSFTIWPQDPFVVLRRPDGGGRLLVSRGYGRLEDREMARFVGRYLDWPVESSSLFFAGGNLVSDERHLFVGPALVEANAAELELSPDAVLERFEQEMGRPVVVVGSTPQPVEHIDLVLTPLGSGRLALADPGRGAELARAALDEAPEQVRAFEEAAEKGFFGHADLETLTGPEGRTLARPELAGRLHEAIDDSAAIAPALDAIARALEQRGYAVLRVPFLGTRLDRPEHRRAPGGSAGYPLLSYNNVLVERDGGRDHVYLPQYGLPALDRSAWQVWQEAGFQVRPIEGLSTSAMYRGSLRCNVKILAREP